MTFVRGWVETDYYADLGVGTNASDAEIGRAYRALAKRLHPDHSGADSVDANRFTRVAVAYGVLSDPQLRCDYDNVDREAFTGIRRRPVVPMGTVPSVAPHPMIRWTPARAIVAMVLGCLFLVSAAATAAVTVRLHVRDNRDTRDRVAVNATVAQGASGERVVMFTDTNRNPVVAPLPDRSSPGVARAGETIWVLYDAANPTDIVAKESHFARNFTLWFIVVKFLVGGPMMLWLGVRKRRTLRRIDAALQP